MLFFVVLCFFVSWCFFCLVLLVFLVEVFLFVFRFCWCIANFVFLSCFFGYVFMAFFFYCVFVFSVSVFFSAVAISSQLKPYSESGSEATTRGFRLIEQ